MPSHHHHRRNSCGSDECSSRSDEECCRDGKRGRRGKTGRRGPIGHTGSAGGIAEYAMFYGLTAGTGMVEGTTDYAAPIPVKTSAGTGRVPFPRSGPTLGSITRVDLSSFQLAHVGTYEVTFKVQTTKPGQLQLELNGTDVVDSVSSSQSGSSFGANPIVGNCFITTTAPNSVLAVINPDGNAAALTITPANGANTHANAQSITIKRLS